jgi:hypothetical protein
MAKKNKIKCIDCIYFMIREIPKDKISKDEFKDWVILRRGIKESLDEKLKIVYCKLERRPLLIRKGTNERLISNCEHAEAF